MWSGLLLSLLLSVSMAFSLTELGTVLRGGVRGSQVGAVQATLAMSVGLTALGLVFSHQGAPLGALAVLAVLPLSFLAGRFASPRAALVISIVALGFYLHITAPRVF